MDSTSIEEKTPEQENEELQKEARRLEDKVSECVFTLSAGDYAAGLNRSLGSYFLKGAEAYERESGINGSRRFPSLSAGAGLVRIMEKLDGEAVVDRAPESRHPGCSRSRDQRLTQQARGGWRSLMTALQPPATLLLATC